MVEEKENLGIEESMENCGASTPINSESDFDLDTMIQETAEETACLMIS